jgi:Tfp pilus assembly protein PilN
MKVRLNLATSSLENNRRITIAAVTVGSLGLIAMVVLAWHGYSVWRLRNVSRAEEAELQGDMTRLRARRAGLEDFFNRPDNVQRRDRAAFLNSLIAERAFPWTRIFMDLERSLPEGVRVITIEPKLNAGHLELRLSIGAASDDGKLQFLKALEESSAFSQIEVLSEARSTKPADIDRVLLSLQARYSAI